MQCHAEVVSVRVFAAVPTARAAAETPPDRDRVVDGARAAALLVVVVGHVLMAVVAWPDGVTVGFDADAWLKRR